MMRVVRAMRSSRPTARPDHGVFDPDTFWGQVLSGPSPPVGMSSFDARVERAWRFMRTMFFTPEEQGALAEALVRVCGRQEHTHDQNQG